MVSLSEVHRSNSDLKSCKPGLVGIFVGGNSGIGASALKAFVKHTTSPTVYILARNETTANEVLAEARSLNPSVKGHFIAINATLLSSIRSACEIVRSRESHINTLVFTCGGFSMTGRQETSEGLDEKLVLNFYARMLAVDLLLPLLRQGHATHGLASVVSILGAGREAAIDVSDLALQRPGAYTLQSQFAHAIVSTDLMFERWAERYSGVSFVHQFPGYVPTKQVTNLGLEGWWTPLRWLLRGVEFLAKPLAVSLEESGERTLFSATAKIYPARTDSGAETGGTKGQDKGEEAFAVGSDGMRGSGAYILHWNGESGGKQNVLPPLREQDTGRTIEEHYRDMVKQAQTSTTG